MTGLIFLSEFFIFELVKISILGSVYATLIVLLFRSISKRKTNRLIFIIGKHHLLLWFISGFVISSTSLTEG